MGKRETGRGDDDDDDDNAANHFYGLSSNNSQCAVRLVKVAFEVALTVAIDRGRCGRVETGDNGYGR